MDNNHHEPQIVVKDLHKAFGERTVLDGIDLEVGRGETLAVLGRSGTGKSVLLKLMIGLQTPDAGAVHILGQQIGGLDVDRINEVRKKIGFSFQHAALYDSLTVGENVAFPLRRHTKMSDAETTDRARELLASVGMGRELEKLPSQISGGMQKRVGIARALALDPEILLFDEPTAGLDPITASEIAHLILELKNQSAMTAVVVTHDLRNARLISDRMLLLHEGKIRVQGVFTDLEKSRDPFVMRYLADSA